MSEEFQPDLFRIDRFRLEEEWVHQPLLRAEWGEKLANARQEHERAKARLDVAKDELKTIEASIALEIRRRLPEDYGLSKFTDPTIENLVQTDARRKEAMDRVFLVREELIQVKHLEDILESKVEAIDQRKMALPDLVRLQMANYYAKPVEPREYREQARDRAFGERKER